MYTKNRYSLRSTFVAEVMSYYSAGHSVKETAETFNVTVHQVNGWAKALKVSNGRTLSELNTEKARIRSAKAIEKAGLKLKKKLEEHGFELIGDYIGNRHKITIRCKECGTSYKRDTSHTAKFSATCPRCKTSKAEERREQLKKQKEAEREEKQAAKFLENPLGLSHYQLCRENVLDIPHICKICGNQYTIRTYMKSIGTKYKRDSGFCSKACREEHKKQSEKESRKRARAEGRRYCCKHYTRAKRLGLPAEEGITKSKLLKRDGPNCALCSLPLQTEGDPTADLYWSIDHIIPLNKGIVNGKGGHTWDNVQLAHRLCNSNKRDLIGRRWNNGNN